MKKFLLIAFFLLIPAGLQAGESAVKWLPLDQAMKEAKKEKKLILIDFYAEWCGYCKKMKRETYTDRKVVERINMLFKAVSVDIEGNKEFNMKGKKTSEREFSDSFDITATPTTFFFKPNGEPIKGVPGYMEPDEFLDILNYFGEGWYEKIGIFEYLEKLPSNTK
ncbi:MAG: hypothetical protein HW382_212 [Deltaproteobacteria bacterium]|nr:hypothetical protein [Deltaproteobacteria bacterium]MBM2837430.1 hypothetical protein [Deltaproteobacteria bacterium]